MSIVDPSKYRSFCFRGQGRCNFVISAKRKDSDSRIVWRLAKHKKSGTITLKPKCEVVNEYLDRILSQFFSKAAWLIRARVVFIHVDNLLHLAKIPSLPHNMKIEHWHELRDRKCFSYFCPTVTANTIAQNSNGFLSIEKNGAAESDADYLNFPNEMHFNFLNDEEQKWQYSRFSTSNGSSNVELNSSRKSFQFTYSGEYVCALEMPDATRIPRLSFRVLGPTITVEIKPKQGFVQRHPGLEDIGYCNNCILQIEKWRSQAFTSMYDFCPLDLYSGNRARMCATIESLVHDPHRNLRIFVNGDVVHDELRILRRDQLGAVCFPDPILTEPNIAPTDLIRSDLDSGHEGDPDQDHRSYFDGVGILASAIACILSGVHDDCAENFRLHDDSILGELLRAQQIDTVGIVRAHEFYRGLPANVQRELQNKSNLLQYEGTSFLRRTDPRSLVERYLLAATMKDCSLMISLKMIDPTENPDPGQRLVQIRNPHNGGTLHFAYSTRVVDLDPKTAKNLENAFARFAAGVRAIRDNPGIHRPCRVYGV